MAMGDVGRGALGVIAAETERRKEGTSSWREEGLEEQTGDARLRECSGECMSLSSGRGGLWRACGGGKAVSGLCLC